MKEWMNDPLTPEVIKWVSSVLTLKEFWTPSKNWATLFQGAKITTGSKAKTSEGLGLKEPQHARMELRELTSYWCGGRVRERTCSRDKLKVIRDQTHSKILSLRWSMSRKTCSRLRERAFQTPPELERGCCSIHTVLSLLLKWRQGVGSKWALGEQERWISWKHSEPTVFERDGGRDGTDYMRQRTTERTWFHFGGDSQGFQNWG